MCIRDSHIVDLANFLNTMGADVRGAGTDVIKIRGVEHLHGCEYSIIPGETSPDFSGLVLLWLFAFLAFGGDSLGGDINNKQYQINLVHNKIFVLPLYVNKLSSLSESVFTWNYRDYLDCLLYTSTGSGRCGMGYGIFTVGCHDVCDISSQT